jgi:hypothetical protein
MGEGVGGLLAGKSTYSRMSEFESMAVDKDKNRSTLLKKRKKLRQDRVKSLCKEYLPPKRLNICLFPQRKGILSSEFSQNFLDNWSRLPLKKEKTRSLDFPFKYYANLLV